jgi:Tol biopolymer transport system component
LALQSGEIFGSYKVVAAIGHGGMGEVYSARDLRLQRNVALKVLPDSVSADPERLARFQREAEVLASLSHATIGGIYGIEETAGRKALVLELIEGPTLADRTTQGRLPLDEALSIARQIATALEIAHDRGVIHRDLKPSNIKVTDSAAVKVLDFGLAKLTEPTGPGRMVADASQSPTITSPALATHAGMILGTAAYMSPEQAKGKPADRRSDMWAFGCVLYEMLTGKRAFQGEDVSETLAEVLKTEPDWNSLPPDTPDSIRRLLRRCLAKDRTARLSDASSARFEIDDAKIAVPALSPASAASTGRLWLAASLVLFLTALAMFVMFISQNGPAIDPAATRFTIQLPPDVEMSGSLTTPLALSRDGRRIAIVAGRDESNRQLWLRSLSQLEPVALRGTEAAIAPFFSPDGRWLAYIDGGALKKVALDGGVGTPIPLTDIGGFFRGGAWSAGGTIVFSASGRTGLMRVSDAGGVAQPLTTPSGEVHSRPHFLPDGHSLLFNISAPNKPTQIASLDLNTGNTRVLLEGEDPRVSAQGYLAFRRGDVLWSSPFDMRRSAVLGEPSPIVDGLRGAAFDVADNGTMIYTPPRDTVDQRSLVWVDRLGAEHPTNTPERAYVYPRISPDGTQFALDIRDQQNDIWIWHTTRRTMARLTFNPVLDRFPVWSPDARFIAYTTEGSGISWQSADGSGAAECLVNSPARLQTFQGANKAIPTSFSPDGSRLLFWGNTTSDMHSLDITSKKIAPLLETPFNERNPELSPDGRWLAYESNESGRFEIHVRPFTDLNKGKWQVSMGGGVQPLWSRNGRELFFRSPSGAVMRVVIDARTSFSPTEPTRLFDGPYFLSSTAIIGRTYDVSPDGQRFLMIKENRRRDQNEYIIVIQNAFAELKPQSR